MVKHTRLSKSTKQEWASSLKLNLQFKSTTLTAPLFTATTSSLTELPTRWACFSEERKTRQKLQRVFKWTKPFHHGKQVSTGLLLVPSPPLRIKDSAAHAGLSPQQVPSKVLMRSQQEIFFPSLNNNSLTVLKPAWAAMADGKHALSLTTSHTTPTSRLTTHTLQLMAFAHTKHPKLQVSMFQLSLRWPLIQLMLYKLLLPNNQFLSQLRPTPDTSRHTLPVFWQTQLLVVQQSTTLS